MAGKSDYFENLTLDLWLGGTTPATIANVYAALFTATPSDSGGGTEVSGGGYARVAISQAATNWSTASSGKKWNANTVNFGTTTASWGTVTHAALMTQATSSSASDFMYYGALSTSKTVNNGDTVSFASCSITVTED